MALECPHCKVPLIGESPRDVDGTICPFCAKTIGVIADEVDEGLLIGWRGLKIRGADGPRPTLHSPMFPLEWKPGEDVTAECAHHGAHEAAGIHAPDPKCTCGFYAGRTRDHLVSMGYQYTDPYDVSAVLVEVAQWGTVVVASNGWRAQHCRLLRVYLPDAAWQLAKKLEATYGKAGVEIVLEDTLNLPAASIPEWCEECGARMKPGQDGKRDLTCEFCDHYNRPVTG